MTEREPGTLGMPISIAKQMLRDDPNTHEIAKGLGVDVETYIDQVIHFALNPNEAPELAYVPDHELVEAGIDVPSVGQVKNWFEAVERGDVDVGVRKPVEDPTTYSTEKDVSETMRAAVGGDVEKAAPMRDEPTGEIRAAGKAGSVLKEQLLAQQRNTQGMRDRRSPAPPKKKD